jgi:type IV pilus assembly protein PilB
MSKKNGSGGKPTNLGALSDTETAERLSMQYRVPMIKLDEYEIDPAIIALVPRDLCERHRAIPVSRAGSSLIVAMIDPTNAAAIEAVKEHTAMNVEPVIATEAAIVAAIARYYAEHR